MDSEPASIDVISTIGTWLAVALALVALVGILGPWLAIRAAFSNENRALNAVHDKHHVYISDGIQVRRDLRLFRRAKIPDLAPQFHGNTAEIPQLVSQDAAVELLKFKQPQYRHWNTGWAKLCALIQAQQVVGTENYETGNTANPAAAAPNIDGHHEEHIQTRDLRRRGWLQRILLFVRGERYSSIADLDGQQCQLGDNPGTTPTPGDEQEQQPTGGIENPGTTSETPAFTNLSPLGGTLDIVESRTAVAASRYWILMLGLLGRYSTPAVREGASGLVLGEFPGERTAMNVAHGGEPDQDGDSASEFTETDGPSWKSSTVANGGGNDHGPRRQHAERYRAYIGSHGAWEISSAPAASIEGYTGTFRDLGRHKGGFVSQSAITFSPKMVGETRETGGPESKRQHSSLVIQFWLAHGFLPPSTKPPDREPYVVLSIQDPVQDGLDPRVKDLLTEEGRENRTNCYLSLRETANVPLSICKSSIALGVGSWKMEQWVAEKGPSELVPIEWISVQSTGASHPMYVRRSHLFKAVSRLLSITWDDWGYLTWRPKSRSDVWTRILTDTASSTFNAGSYIGRFLHRNCTTPVNDGQDGPQVAQAAQAAQQNQGVADVIPDGSVLDWKVNSDFYAPKMAEFVKFEVAIETWTSDKERSLPIAFLFITDRGFRKQVLEMLKCLSDTNPRPRPDQENQGEDEEENQLGPVRDNTTQEHPLPTQEALEEREQGEVTRVNPSQHIEEWRNDVERASRLSERGENASVLASHGARSQSSIEGPEPENLGAEEQTIQNIRGDGTWRERVVDCTSFKYFRTQNAHGLKWKAIWQYLAQYYEEVDEVSLPLPLEGSPGGPRQGTEEVEIEISDTDIIFIAIWAATRCAIWISSEDSRPLIKFVNNLDRCVWVI